MATSHKQGQLFPGSREKGKGSPRQVSSAKDLILKWDFSGNLPFVCSHFKAISFSASYPSQKKKTNNPPQKIFPIYHLNYLFLSSGLGAQEPCTHGFPDSIQRWISHPARRENANEHFCKWKAPRSQHVLHFHLSSPGKQQRKLSCISRSAGT